MKHLETDAEMLFHLFFFSNKPFFGKVFILLFSDRTSNNFFLQGSDIAGTGARKLLKGQQAVPIRIITDKVRSYSAALKELIPDVEHSTKQDENNRGE